MHICMDEIRMISGIIPMIPEMITFTRIYIEQLYFNTCKKCRNMLLRFKQPDHSEHLECEND